MAFGQILSFLLACTGAAQATLSLECGLSAPSFSVGLFYICLVGFLWPVYRRDKQHEAVLLQQDVDIGESDSSSPGLGRQNSLVQSADEMDQCDNNSNNNNYSSNRSYPFLSILSLRASPWVYFAMAILDVYANYFTVLAFKYTSITSVTLLDALAIPSAMLLSRIFLHRSYTGLHFLGVILCMIGIIFNVLQDYEDDTQRHHDRNGNGRELAGDDDDDEVYPHKLRGDFLAVLGGLLFGANNTLGEVAVRTLGGPNEYLGMLGFFATIICTIQAVALEQKQIGEFFDINNDNGCTTFTSSGLLFAFVLCNVLSYAGASRFLQVSEAAFFNLSLLTGDMWSVAFSIIAEHIVPHPFFFVALVLTLSGVFIYEMAPSPVVEDREEFKQETSWRENGDDREIELHLHHLSDNGIT